MSTFARRLLQITLAAAAGAGFLFINESVSPNQPRSLISTAEARIGHPATPRSYAGVARRTTRRAVAAGAVYGAARHCVRAIDAHGRYYTRCY